MSGSGVRRGLLAAVMALSGWGAAQSQTVAAAPAAPVPIEAFFGAAPLQSAVLSPSGRWLAAVVQPKGERARLVVSDLEDKEPARVVAMFSRLDVGRVQWVGDEWLVFNTVDRIDLSGERRGPGLMSVRRDGERIRLLIKRELDTLFPPPGSQPLEANHYLLALGAPGSDEIIVGQSVWAAREFSHTVPVALNVATGQRRSLVDKPPPDADDWIFDAQGRARVATAVRGNEVTLHWLDASTGAWRVIGRYARLEVDFWPSFVDEADRLYVSHTDAAGFSALSRFDLATGKPAAGPLVSTPGFSGSIDAIQSRRDGSLQGVRLLTDGRSQVWFSASMKAVQAKVEARLPGRINLLGCGSCENPAVVLVYSATDRSPGEYFLYRPAADQWQAVGARRPDVEPARMAGMELHRIKARDGGDLPVWITRMPGATPGPKPAVVLVHGGPWSRGAEWAWDAEAQFLASRGYVVIEPEFRGSTGYGDKHYRSGWKQWGQAMQDDVSDALRFAVRGGWVDEKRVCIAGASYGGYATLMGLAKDPDQYRCGVAWLAVSDPRLMFSIHWSDIDSDHKQHTMPQMIGDLQKDAAMLAANSPLEQAARIKSPVFLAYGGRDRRVPIDHGERMREALRKAGNNPEWQVYDEEAHGWSRPENRIDFWRRVEGFLAKHLK